MFAPLLSSIRVSNHSESPGAGRDGFPASPWGDMRMAISSVCGQQRWQGRARHRLPRATFVTAFVSPRSPAGPVGRGKAGHEGGGEERRALRTGGLPLMMSGGRHAPTHRKVEGPLQVASARRDGVEVGGRSRPGARGGGCALGGREASVAKPGGGNDRYVRETRGRRRREPAGRCLRRRVRYREIAYARGQ